jgi:uncharacterized delta-60 repeat protein
MSGSGRRATVVWCLVVALFWREAAAADGAPAIAEQPASVLTTAGGVASFRVVANGTVPLVYQWFHDTQPIAGATAAILVIDQLVASHAGRYFAAVSNSLGTATSASATLTVQPQTLTPIVDPTFQGDARLDGSPTAILPLADGRVLLADGLSGKLVRLLADGRLDPGFAPGAPEALFGGFDAPLIRQLAMQTDGRMLVAGRFVIYGGFPRAGLVRLNTDGTVDETFSPPADLATYGSTYPADVTQVAVQSDGRILVLDFNRRLARLLPDGRRDDTFVLAGINTSASATVTTLALASNDRLYVSAGTGVARYLPDGSVDPTFTRNVAGGATDTDLFPLADGRLIVGTQTVVGGGRFPVISFSTVRLLANGSVDASYPALAGAQRIPPAVDGTLLRYDGTLVAPDGTKIPLDLGLWPYRDDSQAGIPPGDLAVFAPDGRIYLAGAFSFYNGVASSRVVRLNRIPVGTSVMVAAPQVLTAWSDATTVTIGQTIILRVAAVGPGPITYEWTRGLFSVRTFTPVFAFSPLHTYEEGDWTVRVLNAAGSATSLPFHVTVLPAPLRVVAQPSHVSLMSGRDASFAVTFATGSEPADQTEVWRRNGTPLPFNWNPLSGLPYASVSNDHASLDLGLATPALAGTYTVTVSNALGQTVTSTPIVVTVDDVSRFVNLSTRAWVGPGEQAAVLGFVVPSGNGRSLVLRGIGPTLAGFGVAGALADPRLEVFDGAGRRLWANDNWTDELPHRTFANVGAFELPTGSRDAVIDFGFPPGSYTVRLSAPPGMTGIGLIELYEGDNLSDRLVNVSSRVFVGPAATPAIAGFAIRGPVAKRVLVRAVGPGLAAFGVGGPLANPRLEIRDSTGALVAANDDWQNQADAAGVASAAASAGAFALAAGSKDAELVLTLLAGNYTALASAADGGSGIALVEVYELP